MDPIRLTNDFVFRYVFGRRESEPILLDLVNAVLLDADVPGVRQLTIANPINLRDAVWAKESVLDVKAIDEEGQQFDVEMQMTRDPDTVRRSLLYWAQLIENAEKEDTDMSTLLSKNPNLERAYEEYQRCTQDGELRELALARERYLRDQASRISSARREGIEEGIKKGIEQGKEAGLKEGERRRAMETASRLLSMGMSVSQAATATGLQEDAVRELKQGDEDGRRAGDSSGR